MPFRGLSVLDQILATFILQKTAGKRAWGEKKMEKKGEKNGRNKARENF